MLLQYIVFIILVYNTGYFQYPEKRDPWSPNTFNATELGQACPQPQGGLLDLTHPGFENYGEDCLNLDIYTPTVSRTEPFV